MFSKFPAYTEDTSGNEVNKKKKTSEKRKRSVLKGESS